MEQTSSLNIMSQSIDLLSDMAMIIGRVESADRRDVILAVSGLRAIRIAESIAHLYEHCRYEEMRILVRSLTEAIINAAYLKTADDSEVTNFFEFDNAKNWQYAQKLEAQMNLNGARATVDADIRSEVHRIADSSTATMTRDVKKPTWSINTPHQRAEYADKASGDNDFLMLKMATWDLCHVYVHSTFTSYVDCIEWLDSGAFPSNPERLRDTERTMTAANHALWTYCKYLNTSFNLQFEDRVVAIAQLNAKIL